MKIETKDGVFELPQGFQLEITEHNHMITEQVDMSIAVSIRPTEHNLKLLSNSNRIDARYKPVQSILVVVSSGVFSKLANFVIDVVNHIEIGGTLYFNVNSFFSQIGNRRMVSLGWKTIFNPIEILPGNQEEYEYYFINLLKNQWATNSHLEDFVVTQVATGETRTLLNGTEEVEDVFVLNGFETFKYIYDAGPAGYIDVFQGEYNHIQKMGDANVSLGLGYGMTPFLRLDYVLTTIFETFGYSWTGYGTLVNTIQAYDGMFLLNKVADAIWLKTKLEYSQLVPDVTVKEFLGTLEKLFKGKFTVDEWKGEAGFVFFNGIDQTNAVDLTPYLASEPLQSGVKFQNILLNVNDNLWEDAENDRTVIDFTIPVHVTNQKNYWMTYQEQGEAPTTYASLVGFDMLQVNTVVHKNTSVMIGAEIREEKEKSNKEILFGFKTLGSLQQSSANKCSTNLFGWDAGEPLLTLSSQYSKFLEYNAQSGIPYECRLRLPFSLLMKIDKKKLHYIYNQQILIESFRYKLGQSSGSDEMNVECSFRTWRNYENRT